MMGGGDVKLAAALALWFSPLRTVKFLVLMSLAGGVLTLVVLGWHRARSARAGPKFRTESRSLSAVCAILAQRFLNQFV